MAPIKRALYIHFEDKDNPNKLGVLNKIDGQIKAFKKVDIICDIFYFKSKKKLYLNEKEILQLPSRILWFRKIIFNQLLKRIKQKSYSFFYIRYFGSDRYLIKFLKEVHKKNIKVFLEFPTFPYDSEVIGKNWLEKYIIKVDKKYRKELSKYVFRAISMANRDEILGISTIKFQNAIDFSKIPVIKSQKVEKSFNMIAVANISRWHAFDRLLNGIYEYKCDPQSDIKIRLTIVGGGLELNKLKEKTQNLELESEVIFKGPKTGEELNKQFEGKHIAIGSLGLHRIGLTSNSTLKIGEYTARGLPSIIAYKDISIDDSVDFVLRIPGDETPVNIKHLIMFRKNLNVDSQIIRQYAETHFSWEKQINKIVELL